MEIQKLLRSAQAGWPFRPEEYQARLADVREMMERQQMDGLLVTDSATIHWIIGLNHSGFFAFTALFIPKTGELQIVIRAMEFTTLQVQVPLVAHVGYGDDDDPVVTILDLFQRAGVKKGDVVGYEEQSWSTPPVIRDRLRDAALNQWRYASDALRDLRARKSATEERWVRRAAMLTDRGHEGAQHVAREGVLQRRVAAAAYSEMIGGGSEQPSMAPFLRFKEALDEEHVTWDLHGRLLRGPFLLELSASVYRYHAPATRIVYIGEAPAGVEGVAAQALAGLDAICNTLRPGALASAVYAAWEAVVGPENARHHCGYMIGNSFPPSWAGQGTPVSLRRDSDLVIMPGMVFHVMSWIIKPGRGRPSWGVSDTALVAEDGGKLLTQTSRDVKWVLTA